MGIPFFDALVRREPLIQGHEILSLKLESLGQPTVTISWF